ncbi:MAG: 30S ribosomal protein S20 [Endomicrobiales bacterium]|nr:30S ribosomal protein S20 [Endomicrobiales bacterium]
MAKLKTGRHTSALKAARQALRRRTVNLSIRSGIKSIRQKVQIAVEKKDKTQASQLLKLAFSEWDKAVKKGVIHSNAAAHQKARLSKMVHAL